MATYREVGSYFVSRSTRRSSAHYLFISAELRNIYLIINVWYNADYQDYSVGVYKVKDLLAGKLEPRYMFDPTDVNAEGGRGFHWP